MRLLGNYWEGVALKFLKKHKLRTISRNFLCKLGEIDLIMNDHDTLVFIEVKYRKNDDWVSAAEAVTREKQKKIRRSAQLFILKHKKYQNWNCRFDVVSIQGNKSNPQIDWIPNAFY